ncbi:replication factor-a protein [Epithele typhae]|uniref:replication factor-a protein n=1 Tax=Epithele typhae TaxID=378194 RepID=UPI0020083069|nr:replication factor-a protein [Epithele typhae]KAH9945846.1 replication factor-a protein [Epithele typhae]
MSFQLTAGICAQLNDPSNENTPVFESQPTLQLLSFKQVGPTGGSATDRYRVIVSDGEHFLQSMLATQLNYLVQEEQIAKGAIAVIEKFTVNFIQNRRLLIILALQIIERSYDKIGSPKPLKPVGGDDDGEGAAAPAAATPGPSSSTVVAAAAQPTRPTTQAARGGRAASIYPIESLSPYQNNWTIKARVTNKSDIRTWSNQRGEGKLFNMTLMDESGEIRATAFNAAVDQFYDRIQEGKVYTISKAKVNLAKRKFSNVNNEYELTLERNTEIEEVHDATDVPTVKFTFVTIEGLHEVPKDATCDIIGVVKDVGELSSITSKATSRVIPKRELTLVDRTNYSVRLTLWGKQAEQYDQTDQPVIAFKGVKVGDFQGRSLSMVSSSTMVVNPDIPEAHHLRGWFDATGSEQTFQAHTNTMSSGGGGVAFDRAEIRNLNDVRTSELGMSDKPDVFSSRATVSHIKSDNIAYPACPTTGCGKKVIEMGDQWRCEKCDKSYPQPEYRYMIAMAVVDYSGQAWFQGFNDVGQALFGMTADELVEIKSRDDTKFNHVIEKAAGTTFNFACRAKQDTYNDTTRVRYGISRIQPLNYREEAQYLANLLCTSDWGGR